MITVMDMVSNMVVVIKVMIGITIVSINDGIIINMLRSRVPACVLDSGRKKASINFTRLSCKILSLPIFFLQHFVSSLNQTQLVFMKDFYIFSFILKDVFNNKKIISKNSKSKFSKLQSSSQEDIQQVNVRYVRHPYSC